MRGRRGTHSTISIYLVTAKAIDNKNTETLKTTTKSLEEPERNLGGVAWRGRDVRKTPITAMPIRSTIMILSMMDVYL
jgi:hypothetical protein